MVNQETRLKVMDNTGAKVLLMIRNLASRKRYARVGDIIVGTIKSATPSGMVKKGEVVKAVIIRTKRSIHRKDGTVITFPDNAVVLINNNLQPKGTRIFGPVSFELKARKFDKIVSLVTEVL